MEPSNQSKLPLATVIIPAFNRERLLRELILSLFEQSLDPTQYEIIVVDDCSVDGTEKMVKELLERAPCKLIYHRMPQNGGPVKARNTAARMAAAEILAFTDSDCRVSPRWLEEGIAPFFENPKVAFVSGPVLDKPEQPVTFFSLPNGTKRSENPVYPTWNIFYRKSTYWEMGGFDESAWIGNVNDRPIDFSDSDLALSIKEKGLPYIYQDNAVVYHEVWTLGFWNWLRGFMRLAYVPAIIRRHPSLRPLLLWRSPFLSPDNFWFYAAAIGVVLGIFASPWALLLALPHLYYSMRSPGTPLSLRRLVRLPARVVLLTLRQTVICGTLILGSIRMGTWVL